MESGVGVSQVTHLVVLLEANRAGRQWAMRKLSTLDFVIRIERDFYDGGGKVYREYCYFENDARMSVPGLLESALQEHGSSVQVEGFDEGEEAR